MIWGSIGRGVRGREVEKRRELIVCIIEVIIVGDWVLVLLGWLGYCVEYILVVFLRGEGIGVYIY